MIFNRPLTEEERRISVRNLFIHNRINGAAYICVGEMIMILLAVRIHCPDAVVTALGAMFYLGFLMLPLGRTVAAHVGAAKCEGFFWAMRNVCALCFASAALWASLGWNTLAAITVLLCSFGFYGCRAAAVVLQQPLIGDITLPEERAENIGRSGKYFYLYATIGLILIITVLTLHETLGTLLVIIFTGSVLGVVSAYYLTLIHETDVLRNSARKPLRADLRLLRNNVAFRRLIYACIALNLSSMLILPTLLLVLKRGYGMTDLNASVMNLAQWVAAIAGSSLSAWAGKKYGPRLEMVDAYFALTGVSLLVVVLTSFAPSPLVWITFFWLIALFVGGMARMVQECAVTHYFLTVVDQNQRIPGSIVLYTCMGAIAGILGIVVSSSIMVWIGRDGATAEPGMRALHAYRTYFAVVALLQIAASPLVLRLTPLAPAERTLVQPHEQHPHGTRFRPPMLFRFPVRKNHHAPTPPDSK